MVVFAPARGAKVQEKIRASFSPLPCAKSDDTRKAACKDTEVSFHAPARGQKRPEAKASGRFAFRIPVFRFRNAQRKPRKSGAFSVSEALNGEARNPDVLLFLGVLYLQWKKSPQEKEKSNDYAEGKTRNRKAYSSCTI